MTDFIVAILAFLMNVLIMVVVHEWGHFYIARLCRVKVDVFAIGFGKTIWSRFDKHGTEWKINIFPLGGYVKMFGDVGPASNPDNNLLSSMTEKEKESSFFYKKLWQKALIVFAGPLMNYILAFLVMLSLTIAYGSRETSNKVAAVEENSPAERSGIIPNDIILDINNTRVKNFLDIRMILSELQKQTNITVLVNRNGQEISLSVEPISIKTQEEIRYKIGVIADIEQVHYSLGKSILSSAYKIYALNSLMIDGIINLLKGNGSKEDLGGPIKIAQISGEAAKSGIEAFLGLLVLLSINLGLVNLLPIPGLDGGHLMYYTFNALAGRPIPQKIQELGFKFGLIVLILLLVVVTYNDILNLFK